MDVMKCLNDNNFLKDNMNELTSEELHDFFTIKVKISKLENKIQERQEWQNSKIFDDYKKFTSKPSNTPPTTK